MVMNHRIIKLGLDSGIKFAPEHVADLFSKEQNESLSYNKVFGFHGNPHLYEMFIV